MATGPDDTVRIGMLANLRPLKRVDDAIRALAALPSGIGPAELVIGGEDRTVNGRSERERLEALAVELGVGEMRRAFQSPAVVPLVNRFIAPYTRSVPTWKASGYRFEGTRAAF